MDAHEFDSAPPFVIHRGQRQHRFMESTDFNAVFRELFRPLRNNIRRGLTIEGQLYGMEMDPCIPGQLLDTVWIPPASRGIESPALLADARLRRSMFDRLLVELRPESLFTYVCERTPRPHRPTLYVEIVSVDACFGADYPIGTADGWHRRELHEAPHRRLDPVALA